MKKLLLVLCLISMTTACSNSPANTNEVNDSNSTTVTSENTKEAPENNPETPEPLASTTEDTNEVSENNVETPDDNTKAIIYSDTKNNFKFVADPGCDNYLEVTKINHDTKTNYNISLPSAKEWKGNLMNFELVSQDEYDNILNDGMPGTPRITLELNDKVLYTRGLIQSWPIESDLPENCREVTAEKI